MGTNLRTRLSRANPYYISKHRRLELVHFCLQYPEWKEYLQTINCNGTQDEWSDPTSVEAIKRLIYKQKVDMVERCCKMAGSDIYEYLLRSVTYGEPFVKLQTKDNIPCSKDYFYDKYHKFWFLLSQEKHMF